MEQPHMKINWKALIALVLIVVVAYLAFDALRSRSFSGADLSFSFGAGPVTVTNPSDEAVAAQLVGKGSRAFVVTSNIEGTSGESVKVGTGAASTQTFEMSVPPGTSEFSVERGTELNFTASTPTIMSAAVQSSNASAAQTTKIAALVIIAGLLFYASNAIGHRWIGMLRRKFVPGVAPKPVIDNA
jgi:hypothetical protein